MKSIREILSELPAGYRERAIANCEIQNREGYLDDTKRNANIGDILDSAFTWGDTVEGSDFWHKVHIACRGDGKYPKLPNRK